MKTHIFLLAATCLLLVAASQATGTETGRLILTLMLTGGSGG